MNTQDTHNTAIAETEKDLSAEDIATTTDQPMEAPVSDGMTNTGGEIPPLDGADSTGNVNAAADTDANDHGTDLGADSEDDAEAEADAEDETEAENEDDTEDDPDSGTALTWDLALTCDSTALNEISNIIIEDDGGLLGDSDLLDSVEAFLDGKAEFGTDKEKLQAGQELTRKFFAQQNLVMSGVVGTFSGYTVQTGRLLIALKSLVKAIGEKWEPWAAEKLKFMAPRTRQACMQLAKVSGIENHLHFGKERLLLLAGAVNGADSDDPIGELLRKYDLEFDPTEEINLDAYKDAVDLVLDFERLKKAGLNVDMESLKKHRADGKTVNSKLINVLNAIKSANGDPNKHLTNPSSVGSDDGEKKAKSFKKIATNLAGTIDWITGHREFIEQVDVVMIDELTTKLEALKRLIDALDTTEAQD